MLGETEITPDFGGPVGEMAAKLLGRRFECQGNCVWKKESISIKLIDKLYGYPHDGGLADKDGKKWWLYYHCKECNYDTSWWKIENRIAKYLTDEDRAKQTQTKMDPPSRMFVDRK